MNRSPGWPRLLAAVALAGVLLAPPVSRAQSGHAPPADSPGGVALAVVCGAGINIIRHGGGLPIVVSVTAFACVMGFLDALLTPDP